MRKELSWSGPVRFCFCGGGLERVHLFISAPESPLAPICGPFIPLGGEPPPPPPPLLMLLSRDVTWHEEPK